MARRRSRCSCCPVGALYFAVYYLAFRFVIARFDLKTPGREPEDAAAPVLAARWRPGQRCRASWPRSAAPPTSARWMPARRGLRVSVASQDAVDEAALRRLGARGLVRPSADALQVVVGPVADQLAGDIRRHLRTPPRNAGNRADPIALLAALGGAGNVRDVAEASTRLLFEIEDDAAVDESALSAAAPRGFARPAPGSLHVLDRPAARSKRSNSFEPCSRLSRFPQTSEAARDSVAETA